jgi:hypothetical protein
VPCDRHQAPGPGEPKRPRGHVLGSLRACTVGRCTLASALEPQKTDPLEFSRAGGNAVTGTAAPHPVRRGEHASPLGAGGPGATLTTPHMGYRFHRAGPVGTGVDHAQVGDCWVALLKERPPLRMGLKPIPPLRTVCMSSNGTRRPLDSRGLAVGARGGPLAVDFDLPRPRLCSSTWVLGADLRLITNEVAACRSQPPTSGDLAWYRPKPSAKG